MASPTARSSAPRVPCPPGVDPVPGPQSPRHLSSDTHSPALARASEPRRPPDAVLGRPATRIREQGEAAPGKSRPPPPGPADRSRLKFAGRSPPNRRAVGGAGGPERPSRGEGKQTTSTSGVGRGTTLLELLLRTGDLIPKADVLVKRAFSTRGNSV